MHQKKTGWYWDRVPRAARDFLRTAKRFENWDPGFWVASLGVFFRACPSDVISEVTSPGSRAVEICCEMVGSPFYLQKHPQISWGVLARRSHKPYLKGTGTLAQQKWENLRLSLLSQNSWDSSGCQWTIASAGDFQASLEATTTRTILILYIYIYHKYIHNLELYIPD